MIHLRLDSRKVGGTGVSFVSLKPKRKTARVNVLRGTPVEKIVQTQFH